MVGESLGSSALLNGKNPFLLTTRYIACLLFPTEGTYGRVKDRTALIVWCCSGQRSCEHMPGI